MTVDLLWRTAKVGAASLTASVSYVWAQVQWPDLDALGSFGLAAVLAGLVARYTFRQLEDYRSDLKNARERIDALEDDLHTLGQAKAASDRRVRELEVYAHQLRIWVVAQAIDTRGIPEPPSLRS